MNFVNVARSKRILRPAIRDEFVKFIVTYETCTIVQLQLSIMHKSAKKRKEKKKEKNDENLKIDVAHE